MIKQTEFFKLRLHNFIPKDQLESFSDWEFMDDYWIGEARGFTDFLQLEEDPSNTRSISLHLDDLSDETIQTIFSTLEIPLKKGLSQEELIGIFGNPTYKMQFVKGRETLEYVIGEEEKYFLSLTVDDSQGLLFITIMDHEKTILKTLGRSKQ